jgi:hypothetical protein
MSEKWGTYKHQSDDSVLSERDRRAAFLLEPYQDTEEAVLPGRLIVAATLNALTYDGTDLTFAP